MNQISVLVVLLSCLSIYTAAKSSECNLEGQWKNELGSKMTISTISNNGLFSGSYLTAVSTANNTIMESVINGFQQQDGSPSFGFTVKWAFSDSITVFTGQCYVKESGRTVLLTTWLLRSKSGNIKDDWKHTRVGSNVFHKVPTKSS